MTMVNKRSLSVDITKGITIIAIVLGHIGYNYPSGIFSEYKRSVLLSMACPCFLYRCRLFHQGRAVGAT